MNDQIDTCIYNELGEKVGDRLSPFFLNKNVNYGYFRQLRPEDNIKDEVGNEKFVFGYFSPEGLIVSASTTKQTLINQLREENLIVLLLN